MPMQNSDGKCERYTVKSLQDYKSTYCAHARTHMHTHNTWVKQGRKQNLSIKVNTQ